MGSISGESLVEWDGQDSNAPEEKIFVSVRLRPLNEKEIAKNDVSDWECINNTTLIFTNSLQERPLSPTAYTFDRVFGPHCPTRQVYEEAAKKIALTVLSGINSSIFTYGQTSSGKTYTMSGITEYAVADIYDYIDKHREREFVLKFSAMEIYNEVLKDLLSLDGTPLRLLDDPVRGAVVEKLTEVTLRDAGHLKGLLSMCEAQRKTGETSLNEMSSRSHQILCLTVESEARECLGAENSSTLTATVNFVDLAGSERSSQTMAAGMRLKEGCHINRSLLTLGTVIRKLSKGRNGHIPYRDSKLTRILQNSLGGNARTAIICTMSPAHSHVEQSKSTLLFANCAKQISTNAQVNIVVSEKALVRQLQREIARLENELRNLSQLAASHDFKSALKEKELVIGELHEEIRQLTHQRDLAQSRIGELVRLGGGYRSSKSSVDLHSLDKCSWTDEYSPSETSEMTDTLYSDISSITSHYYGRCRRFDSIRLEDQFPENCEDQFLSDNTSPRLYIDKYFGPQSPDPSWLRVAQEAYDKFEDNCDEIQCIEFDFTNRNMVASASSPYMGDNNSGRSPCSSDEDVFDPTVNASEIQTTFEEIGKTSENEADSQGKLSNAEPEKNNENPHAEDPHNEKEERIDCKIKQQKSCVEEELKEIINPELVKQFEDVLDLEDVRTAKNAEKAADGGCEKDQDKMPSTSDWHAEFERQKKEIIELWDTCNIPLVYRTYFFLLFKGDPSDTVYLELELRRLLFLKAKLHGNKVMKDDQFPIEASSVKTLNREREMLSRQMLKKFSGRERKALYRKWGIDLKKKKRRIKLCRLLWTDTTNMEHIKESAAIVAKLVGFKEPLHALKEMIGLNFTRKHKHHHRSFSWIGQAACLP